MRLTFRARPNRSADRPGLHDGLQVHRRSRLRPDQIGFVPDSGDRRVPLVHAELHVGLPGTAFRRGLARFLLGLFPGPGDGAVVGLEMTGPGFTEPVVAGYASHGVARLDQNLGCRHNLAGDGPDRVGDRGVARMQCSVRMKRATVGKNR